MINVLVQPHEHLCPKGCQIECVEGDNLLEVLLKNDINIEHACDKVGVCSTCHVYIRHGGDSVSELSDHEDDHLETAWGLDADSRLSCQVFLGNEDITIELPKYTLNLAGERD